MTQLTVQIPDSVLSQTRKLAEREHLSVEEFVSRLLGDLVRLDELWAQRVKRGRSISRERFLEILRKAPDVEPAATDRIE